MRALIKALVPVRMGIAVGSFKALKFETESVGTSTVHLSEFTGTGVVRAYQAEKSGSHGLRILLHPSLRAHIGEDRANPRYLILDEARPDAYAELNFLDLPLKAPTEYTWKDQGTYIIESFSVLQASVATMGRDAPESKKHYYWNTVTALNRMRHTAMDNVLERLNGRGDWP